VSCEWGRGAGFATSPDPSQPNSHAELVNWPGSSLVGQIGVLVAPNGGMIAVALAAPPDSGKFDDGHRRPHPRWPAGSTPTSKRYQPASAVFETNQPEF
jgi:hypothetical protein